MSSQSGTERLGHSGRKPSGRQLVAGALFAGVATLSGLVTFASGRTFNSGNSVVVGPKYSGPVPVSPGCVAMAQNGRVSLPYRRGGPNELRSVLGWVIIPRS